MKYQEGRRREVRGLAFLEKFVDLNKDVSETLFATIGVRDENDLRALVNAVRQELLPLWEVDE